MLENEINFKLYIGMTENLDKRLRSHQHISNGNCEENRSYLHRAIDKHGWDNFECYILNEVGSQESAEKEEIRYISFFNTFKGVGYNCSKGGRGVKSSEEHPRVKVSDQKILKIMEKYQSGEKLKQLTKEVPMKMGPLVQIFQGKRRKYLQNLYEEKYDEKFQYRNDKKKYSDEIVKECIKKHCIDEKSYTEISKNKSIDYSLIYRWCNGKKRSYIFNELKKEEVI